MCYYYFGKDYVFTSQRALQLVEHGVCPLKYRSGNELVTRIAEPLVAWTAYKFFEDIGNSIEVGVLQQMGAFRILPSSLGLLVEQFLIPAIVAYFTKEKVSLDQVYSLYSASFSFPFFFFAFFSAQICKLCRHQPRCDTNYLLCKNLYVVHCV
jgi:hypothetical protein